MLVLDAVAGPVAGVWCLLGALTDLRSLTVVVTTREDAREPGVAPWPVPPMCWTDAVELLRVRAGEAGADLSVVCAQQLRPLVERLGCSPATIEAAGVRLGERPATGRGRRPRAVTPWQLLVVRRAPTTDGGLGPARPTYRPR